MREMKCRVWHKRTRTFNDPSFIGSLEILEDGRVYIRHPEKDQFVVTWTIGRNDKNGREIFEGDLIRDCKGRVLQVAWANHYSRYMASTDGEWCTFYLNEPMRPEQDTESMEVVGTIFENPGKCIL